MIQAATPSMPYRRSSGTDTHLAKLLTTLHARRSRAGGTARLPARFSITGERRPLSSEHQLAPSRSIVNSNGKQQFRVSSAHSRELGEELRRARQGAEMSSGEVVAALGWSLGKLSKLETGSRGTGIADIAALLGRYATGKAAHDRVLALATETDTGSFLRVHDTCMDTLTTVGMHEHDARTVTTYEPLTIPALAQSENYTAALTGDRDIARVRAARNEKLRDHRSGRRHTVIYLYQTALHLVVGDRAVMHEQMLHLITLADRLDVTVRVIPVGRGGRAALCRPGTLLDFDAPTRPVVFVETDAATVVHDDPGVVAAYRKKMRALEGCALDAGKSRDLIADQAVAYRDRISVPLRIVRAEPGTPPQAAAGV
ncbi:helix-turn-helix domain-containing protein [Saccharothrix lopnurensis]|uniref:Helix-turn-helix domain-containing protein n=1 Tax=Saccharothrix lopnurensis TaxID=1670621 RepID=A0ABW1PEC0_9PSEU